MIWRSGNYSLTDERASLDIEATVSLIQSTYWGSARPRDTILRSLEHSLTFGLFHHQEQVGFARLVTDFATVGYLCDVIIDEKHRGQGCGKWLLRCVLEHPAVRGCRIDLFTRDAQDFYRAFGFGPHRYTSLVRYPPDADAPPSSSCKAC